ncbi:MAG: glycosyltransferase family 9 protein [Melioribacteraceae bacterium]
MKKIEIYIRKLILKLLLLIIPKKSVVNKIDLKENSTILFIRLNRIGDALITTPLLSLIKKNTNHKIYVVASNYNYLVFSSKIVDNVIVYDKKRITLFKLIRLINKLKPDAIIDLHDDVSTTVSFILTFSKAKYKIGFNKDNRKLYNYIIEKPNPSKTHVIERILQFTKIFNIKYTKEEIRVFYYINEKALEKISNYIINNKLDNYFKIGINISAGNDARFWGIKNYKDLITEISKYSQIKVIILCSPNDIEKAKQISNELVPIFYDNSFENFSAMISKLDLLITPDTSAVHIASAFNIPVFGLYVKYNTNDMIWSPYNTEFECVITEQPTLKNIQLNEVLSKLKPFLEKLLWKN